VRIRTHSRWLGSTSVKIGASRASPSDRNDHEHRRSRSISVASTPPIPDDQRDDRAIVDAILAGDRDAYRHLVERESASIVRACHRVLGDLHEAEDAAQEAFVTAYRSLATWRGDGPFGAWLTRIAIRIALRQAGRRRSVRWLDPAAGADRADPTTQASRAQALAASTRTDPAMLALRAEREEALRAAVSVLPEPYRETVTLRFFGELSLDEIARQTERPLPTVKTHLRRGLQRLRGTVEPWSDA
jgi:RNA polymerase sigma-70 factor (ECF subfamily)